MEPALDGCQVGQHQLELQSGEVVGRIGVTAAGGGHRRVLEGPQDVDEGVDLAQAAEEAVAEAFAGAGSLGQGGDVDELHAGRHDLAGLRHVGQLPQPLVRHLGDTDRRLRGGERVSGNDGVGPGQGIEQAGLPGVGQADKAEALHRPRG
jgi:hypothetical protein